MRGVNKVILIGNLGKDPELHYLSSGQAVVKFPLATGAKWKDKEGQWQDRTDWHNIVAFGRQAEVCNEYLKKGSPVYVEGRIQNRSWEDKDGNKKYITEIISQSLNLLGKKGEPNVEIPEEIEESNTEEKIKSEVLKEAKEAEMEDLPF